MEMKVTAAGGHSSVPPRHTSIGLLSMLIAHLEEHPHPVHLTRTSTVFESFQCFAAHAPNIPDRLRRDLLKAQKSDEALRRVEKMLLDGDSDQSKWIKALLGTTQAVDIISGLVRLSSLRNLPSS